MAQSGQTFFPPEMAQQYDNYNVAGGPYFYESAEQATSEKAKPEQPFFNVNGDAPYSQHAGGDFQQQFAAQDVYSDPTQDFTWMSQGQNQMFQMDPRFQQQQQPQQQQQQQPQFSQNQFEYSQMEDSVSPVVEEQASSTQSPMPQQQQQQTQSPMPQSTQSPAPQQTLAPAPQAPSPAVAAGGVPPPKVVNGVEYNFVPGLGYYPVSRIPELMKHQAQAQAQPVQAPAQPPLPKLKLTKPRPPPKKKVVDPTVLAAGALTASVSSKKRVTDMPEGDASILEKVADKPDVADIIRVTFSQLQDQKEVQAKVAFSAARLLLSVPETQFGKTKPDLMAICLSNCYSTFSGERYHDFWRAMRRYQNFIVRLRAWMVFNVNKRFIEECTHALDFLLVMRLSHDTLLQFKFDKVLKKIIKLGTASEKQKSEKILEQAAQTVKASPTPEEPAPAPAKEPGPAASSSAVTAAIAAAKAKSAAKKPAAKAGSFFKSLSKPEEKKEAKPEPKIEVKKVEVKKVEPKETKPEVKPQEVKPEVKPVASKPPPSAFNDVMANILRVPTKRSSPTASSSPVEAKKQKVKKKVSWRPDDELVDIRFFESEKDENKSMHGSYRDMDKEEGRGLIGNNSEVDIDFDPVEDEQQEWYEPQPLSFEGVADDISPNPPKRGGTGEIESTEAELMAQRNKTTLATVYGPDDDIPESPTEPSEASQNPLDLPDTLLTEPKEMVVAERTKKMLGIMSGAYRVVPKHSFKGDRDGDNVCEAYDTVFVGESAPEKPAEAAIPAFDISKLPGFASVASSGNTPPPPPPPTAAAVNPLAALAALPGMENLIPALQAAANPGSGPIPQVPGLPPGMDPVAFVQALTQMQQNQPQQPQQNHHRQPDRNDCNDRGYNNHNRNSASVDEMRKRDVRPDIARNWDKLPSNRYSQPCRFFNTDKACSRGDQCIFLHLPRN